MPNPFNPAAMPGDVATSGFVGQNAANASPSAYDGIYAWIRDLLTGDANNTAALPDAALGRYVLATIRVLRSNWDCLPVYGGLTGDDALAYDEAIGHLTAARLRRKLAKTVVTGEPTKIKIQGNEFDFAVPVSAGLESLETEWMEMAWRALQTISCIAAILAPLRAMPLFAPAGKRRAQEARGIYAHSINPLFTLMIDEWDQWTQHPFPLLPDSFGWLWPL